MSIVEWVFGIIIIILVLYIGRLRAIIKIRTVRETNITPEMLEEFNDNWKKTDEKFEEIKKEAQEKQE